MSEQPVALVTGSGRGIGRGIAQTLAREGYTVIVNSVTGASSEEAKRLIESEGGRAEVCLADVGNGEDRARLVECVESRFGRLDLLVNNAGVAPKERADILDASEASFCRLMNINLRGPYFLTQALARRMIEWKRAGKSPTPRISFITSISAYTASINRGDYCISKAGLSMAAALFASRLAGEGIPVIEIRPGIVATDMTAGVKEKYDHMLEEDVFPQQRWGTPEDVARAVAAFARGDLDYSAGAVIEVSGGFQLRRL